MPSDDHSNSVYALPETKPNYLPGKQSYTSNELNVLIALTTYTGMKERKELTLREWFYQKCFDITYVTPQFRFLNDVTAHFKNNAKDATQENVLLELLNLHAKSDPNFKKTATGRDIEASPCQSHLYGAKQNQKIITVAGSGNAFGPLPCATFMENYGPIGSLRDKSRDTRFYKRMRIMNVGNKDDMASIGKVFMTRLKENLAAPQVEKENSPQQITYQPAV